VTCSTIHVMRVYTVGRHVGAQQAGGNSLGYMLEGFTRVILKSCEFKAFYGKR
jgi:hypothetical protein